MKEDSTKKNVQFETYRIELVNEVIGTVALHSDIISYYQC